MRKAVLLCTLGGAVLVGYAGMDQSKINIGVYCLGAKARTESHIRDLRDCGVNFVTSIDGGADMRPTFDLFQKYGIGAFVPLMSPYWNEEQHLKGTDINTFYSLERCAAHAEKHVFRHHPAVWGYDLGDEPGAGSFPFFGKLAQEIRRRAPEKQIYLNLYPNCVPKRDAKQPAGKANIFWDTFTYEEYIAAFCAQVPVDHVCYDFYLYRDWKRRIPLSYENMRVVAEACRANGRDFWTVLQVNSCHTGKPISLNGLRFQAYQAMAYGASTLLWACYSPGWWHHNVLTKEGEKTEQYEKLKKVNAEIHSFERFYKTFRNCGTKLVGDFSAPRALFKPSDGVLQPGEQAGTSPVWDDFSNGIVSHLRSSDGSALIVGDMVSRTDEAARAIFLCAADDPMETAPARHEVVFTLARGYDVQTIGIGGALPIDKDKDKGERRFVISSNEGVLLVLTRSKECRM